MQEDFYIVEGWSETRYWIFIRSLLRKGWSKYPPKYSVLKESRREIKVLNNGKRGKRKWEFQCNECKKWYFSENVSVDHIYPCGTLKSFEDLPRFCKKLFCKKHDLQVLCDRCHDTKSYMERFNISKQDAIKKIELINFFKKPIQEQKSYLQSKGFIETDMSNKKKREECFNKIRQGNKNGGKKCQHQNQ